jgi:hypothetical protein
VYTPVPVTRLAGEVKLMAVALNVALPTIFMTLPASIGAA